MTYTNDLKQVTLPRWHNFVEKVQKVTHKYVID